MKGICRTLSRSPHFSPFIPGDRYLKFGLQAMTGAKPLVTSSGTRLWRHVHRHCAKFLAFMEIKGSGYFLYVQAQISFVFSVVSFIFSRCCYRPKNIPWVFSVSKRRVTVSLSMHYDGS